MRRLWTLLGLVLVLAAATQARAGEVGTKLADYSSAGAGVGALVGAAVATVPYLQSNNPYDFYTGAGIGLLAGSGVGFLLGCVDVASDDSAQGPRTGFQMAYVPGGWCASYTLLF
jgi:hypothetical protein